MIATERTLSYKELNEEANAVGHVLFSKGVRPDTIVAVLAERDSRAYVMRQGVLKSGGAFLPIDPYYPGDRIHFILEDSGANILLTTTAVVERRKEFFDKLAHEGKEIVIVQDAVSEGEKTDLNLAVPYEALAYVIYTSGSTGRPKGVMLTNKNLVNFADDNDKNHEIRGYTAYAHRSLAIAALTFDFSIMEEFVPLANGMTVVLATQEEILDPYKLGRLMIVNGVDVMSCTPSYMSNLLDTDAATDAVRALKSIDFGAEAFPSSLYKRLRDVNPQLYIMNGYGPTEATISCTMQVVEDGNDITIGIPGSNVHVVVMDENGEILPLGNKGELVILGDGSGISSRIRTSSRSSEDALIRQGISQESARTEGLNCTEGRMTRSSFADSVSSWGRSKKRSVYSTESIVQP